MENPPVQPTPPPPTPATGPITYPTRRTSDGAGWYLARLALVVVSILLLGLARDRLVDFQRNLQVTFRPQVGWWFLAIVLAVLAGAAFGLAIVLPRRVGRGYRTSDLVALGTVPLVYVIVATLFMLDFTTSFDLPGFFDRVLAHTRSFFSFEVNIAGAVLLGIALVAGLRGRDEGTPPAPLA